MSTNPYADLPGPDDNDESTVAESFRSVDLAAVFANGLQQPKPSMLMRRGDDIESGLIYTGVVNGLHGDSGTGKSWTSVLLIVERLALGETVMLIDLEDTPESVLSRLVLVGGIQRQIVEQLIYRRPTDPFGPAEMSLMLDEIAEHNVTAVVIDSLGEAFGTEGINEDRDNEVGPWLRSVARVLAAAGPAVVLIDHSTKSNDNQLHPSGSKRKRAAIGGASYLVEVVTGFAKGKSGRLRITCAKDRHGTYRRSEHVAWLDMNTHPDGSATLELIAPSQEPAADAGELVTLRLMGILSSEPEPISLRKFRALVRESKLKISNSALDDAIELAVHRGFIIEQSGPKGSRLFSTTGACDE